MRKPGCRCMSRPGADRGWRPIRRLLPGGSETRRACFFGINALATGVGGQHGFLHKQSAQPSPSSRLSERAKKDMVKSAFGNEVIFDQFPILAHVPANPRSQRLGQVRVVDPALASPKPAVIVDELGTVRDPTQERGVIPLRAVLLLAMGRPFESSWTWFQYLSKNPPLQRAWGKSNGLACCRSKERHGLGH
jgi:hypothetical protein